MLLRLPPARPQGRGAAICRRQFTVHDRPKRPHPNPARANYTDSYRTTAAFINYVAEPYGKGIPRKLNAVMREATYTPDFWNQCTGTSAEQLWDEHAKTLRR